MDYTDLRVSSEHVDPNNIIDFIRSVGGFFANTLQQDWINDSNHVVAIIQRSKFIQHLEDFRWWADHKNAYLEYDLVENKKHVIVRFTWNEK